MYSLDRRVVALHVYSMLSSLRKTALMIGVSHSTVGRWVKQPKKQPYPKRKQALKVDQIVDLINITIQQNPFSTLSTLRDLIKETIKIDTSRELIRTVIKANKYSRKQARFYGEPKNLKERTIAFVQERDQMIAKGYQFVSVDETSFGRSSSRVMGYSRRGIKLFVRKRVPHVTTVSCAACVSKDGLVAKESRSGSYNTDHFLSFLKSLQLVPKTVILLDNVPFHHSKCIKEHCLSKGWHLLFVPPYSPWYNPIEFCFSVVKRHYYKHHDIEKAFESLTQHHCQAFFDKSLNCDEALKI